MKCGFVILPTFSLILILGIIVPFSSSMAVSLYTPPNTASDLAVMSRSPTPNRSICAPWLRMSSIIYSSSEFEHEILQLCQPASSSSFRAFFVRYVMSPESSRMPHFVSPRGFKTSLKTRMAFGMPDLSVLYVSTSSVGFSGYVSQ